MIVYTRVSFFKSYAWLELQANGIESITFKLVYCLRDCIGDLDPPGYTIISNME